MRLLNATSVTLFNNLNQAITSFLFEMASILTIAGFKLNI